MTLDTFRAMCPSCNLLTVVRAGQGLKCMMCGWEADKPAGTFYCEEKGGRLPQQLNPPPAGSKEVI